MKVKFVDLKAQYDKIKDEIDAAIGSVIEQSAFIRGKYVDSFERNFAAYLGVDNCVGVANGTDAIFIALKSLGIGPGDEVVTVANTFIATAEAITMTGARVVFTDCDKSTYNISVKSLEKVITKKTRAIVVVHLYGLPADMGPLMEVARAHNLFVVEDCAQAIGAAYRGAKVGTMGDAGCFSFFPGKNLGAYGDAGAIVTNDAGLAKRARMFANHGREDKFGHRFEGTNSRLDGLQAAVLDVKLGYLDKWNARRRSAAAEYDEGLGDLAVTPRLTRDAEHVYHLYVVRVKQREKVRGLLAEQGISTGVHYPTPLPLLDAYAYLGHKPYEFPGAFSLKDEIMSLPIHGDITDAQVDYVIYRLGDILKGHRTRSGYALGGERLLAEV